MRAAIICVVLACSVVAVKADTVRKSQQSQSPKKVAAKTSSSMREPTTPNKKGKAVLQPVSSRSGKKSIKTSTGIRANAPKGATTPAVKAKKKWVQLKQIMTNRPSKNKSLLASKKNGKQATESRSLAARQPLSQPKIMGARLVPSPAEEMMPPSHEVNARGILATAFHYLKTAYRAGGSSPRGFDCSGFTHYIFSRHGISLPRSSVEQAQRGFPVSAGQLRAGDLVFFSTFRRGISHVGIFIANGLFIHSSGYGKGVMLDSISSSYWGRRFIAARRVDLSGAKQYAMAEAPNAG